MCAVFCLPIDDGETSTKAPEHSKAVTEEFKLTVNKKEKQTIYELITTLGEQSAIRLGFKKSHLTQLGAEISHVPTLQFLGYIFSTPKLKKEMRAIHSSSLKWKPFIHGVAGGLQMNYDKGYLQKELASFAAFLHADLPVLQTCMDKKDWEGFVVALMK